MALRVTDMDRTLRFYHEVLGLDVVRISGPDAAGVRMAIVKAGGQELNLFSRADHVAADPRIRSAWTTSASSWTRRRSRS